MNTKHIQYAAIAVSCLSMQLHAMDIEPEAPENQPGRIPVSELVNPENKSIYKVSRLSVDIFEPRQREIREQVHQECQEEITRIVQVADKMCDINEMRHRHNLADADRIQVQNNATIDWEANATANCEQERDATILASRFIDDVLQRKGKRMFKYYFTNKYKEANGGQISTTFAELVKNMPQSLRVAKRKYNSITSCIATLTILQKAAQQQQANLERAAKKARIEKQAEQ